MDVSSSVGFIFCLRVFLNVIRSIVSNFVGFFLENNHITHF